MNIFNRNNAVANKGFADKGLGLLRGAGIAKNLINPTPLGLAGLIGGPTIMGGLNAAFGGSDNVQLPPGLTAFQISPRFRRGEQIGSHLDRIQATDPDKLRMATALARRQRRKLRRAGIDPSRAGVAQHSNMDIARALFGERGVREITPPERPRFVRRGREDNIVMANPPPLRGRGALSR